MSSPLAPTPTLSSVDNSDIPTQDTDPLTTVRNELIENGYYLGDQSNRFYQRVDWERVGRSNQLFTKPFKSEAGVEPSPNHIGNSSQPDTLSQSSAGSSTSGTHHSSEPAVLTAVVTIGYSSFLMPCANWDGPSEYAKSFADAKLSLKGQCPSVTNVFHDDFSTCIVNAKCLVDQIAEPNVRSSGFVIPPEKTGFPEGLRFRHRLFDALDTTDELPNREPVCTEDPFSLANWPIVHPEAQAARDDMLLNRTHALVPLPAYDINGDLIPPQNYRRALCGSVARVRFNLTHWLIERAGKPSSNAFTADLVSVRVLVKPPDPRTPRKTQRTDPGLEQSASPMKKARRI